MMVVIVVVLVVVVLDVDEVLFEFFRRQSLFICEQKLHWNSLALHALH